MNAANEVAVEAFLGGRISFPRIWGLVEEVMGRHPHRAQPTLEDLLEADAEARRLARDAI
jgi:1-deoxy-D-xylulose-5-phosphate reductoisomerase